MFVWNLHSSLYFRVNLHNEMSKMRLLEPTCPQEGACLTGSACLTTVVRACLSTSPIGSAETRAAFYVETKGVSIDRGLQLQHKCLD